MKISQKRIQLIYEERKFWQIIDCNRMITIEHVWNDLSQHFDWFVKEKKYQFSNYQTKIKLPEWYHVDLLKDNDQILIEEQQTNPPVIEPVVHVKHTSKKKQLNTYLTNRSFVLTNKYAIPMSFYERWEEGKRNKITSNCQMIF